MLQFDNFYDSHGQIKSRCKFYSESSCISCW